MTGQELLSNVYTVYRGKIASRTPAWGSEKAIVLLNIANRKQQEWATDPRNKWNSQFLLSAPIETGTVATAGTTALTGTGTFFTDYRVGDTILVSGETVRTIATIVSDTSLTVTVAFSNTDSGLTFTRNTIIDDAVQSYNLHRRLYLSSDFARVVKTDDTYFDFGIVKAQQRNITSSQAGYIHGLNPKTFTFAQTMDSGLDGAELFVPGYYIPESITASTDLVVVDDPNWLVYIVASELARNDPAKDDQFPTLSGMANELYMRMSNANNDVGFLQMNSIVNNMPQISNDLDEDWTV